MENKTAIHKHRYITAWQPNRIGPLYTSFYSGHYDSKNCLQSLAACLTDWWHFVKKNKTKSKTDWKAISEPFKNHEKTPRFNQIVVSGSNSSLVPFYSLLVWVPRRGSALTANGNDRNENGFTVEIIMADGVWVSIIISNLQFL